MKYIYQQRHLRHHLPLTYQFAINNLKKKNKKYNKIEKLHSLYGKLLHTHAKKKI